MDIHSDNLGPDLAALIQRRRASETQSFAPGPDSVNALTISLVVCLFFTLMFGLVGADSLTWVTGLITAVLLFFLCKRMIERADARSVSAQVSAALTQYEVRDLASPQNSPLTRSYLELAVDVLRADIPDTDAQREVRAALQALGTTVHALPADEPKAGADDPNALRADADRLASEADAEPDAVIAASLRRRAESLSRRADTAARTLLLLRRNQALRQETAEQIEALKTSLTAFRVGRRRSAPELADLAASIQRVAREANAITEARAEVESLIAAPYRGRAGRAETDPVERQSVGG